MAKAVADRSKKRGRPAVGATPIGVRIPPDQLVRLDAWMTAQPDKPSRPAAIRWLLDRALTEEMDRA